VASVDKPSRQSQGSPWLWATPTQLQQQQLQQQQPQLQEESHHSAEVLKDQAEAADLR